MITRKITGGLLSLTLLSIIYTLYSNRYKESMALLTTIIFTTYILFIVDERVKPHNNMFDWVTGDFKQPKDMKKHLIESRLNAIEYKSQYGPFKIRFVYNKRFSKDEIEESKEKLKHELPSQKQE